MVTEGVIDGVTVIVGVTVGVLVSVGVIVAVSVGVGVGPAQALQLLIYPQDPAIQFDEYPLTLKYVAF